MGRFASANEDKKKIEELILSNQKLLKYIYYTDSSPLLNLDIENTTDLLKTHVFFKPKIPNVSDTAQNMLVIHLTNFKLGSSSYFKVGKVIFDIICHDTLLDLDNGNLRYLCIADELDSIFNKSTEISIGETKLDFCNEIVFNENYFGLRYAIEFMDFN